MKGAPEDKEESELSHEEGKIKLKPWQSVTLVVSLAFLVAIGGLCIAASMRQGTKLTSASLVFLVNAMRVTANLIAFFYQFGSENDKMRQLLGTSQSDSCLGVFPRFNMQYAIPSLMYCFSDNIAFLVLAHINPATFSIIWNCKTAVVAVLMRLVLVQKPFAWVKWGGVGLLLIGPTLVELGSKKEVTKGGENGEHAPIYWHALCLGGACISAAANVYTEWVLKKYKIEPMIWQNVQMYTFASVFTLIALICQKGFGAALDLVSPEFLMTHISGLTIVAILMQVTQAFIVPAILKYVDNIADLYAHAGAVLITAFFSWMFFELKITIWFTLGMLASVCSLFLYYSEKIFTPQPGASHGTEVDFLSNKKSASFS